MSSYRCHFAVQVAIAVAVLVSAGPMSAHATVIKLAYFGENLSGWTNEGELEPLQWNGDEQAVDFTAPGIADWDLPSDVQVQLADGSTNTWTISFDVRLGAVESDTELNIRPQTAAGTELLNIGFEQDDSDSDKWQIVPTGQGGGNGEPSDHFIKGLFVGDWYHIDLVFNRSGDALTDYNGTQDLADDQVDLWVDGLLGASGIDMTNDTPEEFTMQVDVGKAGVASFDNFEIHNVANVARVTVNTWDGDAGDWRAAMWNGTTAPAADKDMVINAADSVVTVAEAFASGGTGPASSVLIGKHNAASLTINSGVTLEVTGATTVREHGTLVIENGGTLSTGTAVLTNGSALVTGVQGSDTSSLLDAGGLLTLPTIDPENAIKLSWKETTGGTQQQGLDSKFGGLYRIATYHNATGLTNTAKPTGWEAGLIGAAYIKSIDYAVDLGENDYAIEVELHSLGDGDCNIDGVVNSLDLSAFGQGWGSSSPAWANGDFNFDGVVNSLDLSAFGQAWGWSAGPAGISPVPEPGTIVMLLIAAAGLLLYRKRR